jgi:hypothetical protein
MTAYQLFLLVVLVLWPPAIMGLLFLMARLERFESRIGASTPEEAGLEPVAGEAPEREVRIRFGEHIIGEPET